MSGLDGHRVYLDWNATAPLRPEARAAMLAAMDVVGNPSSVHAEGRAARAIVEKARGQVAALVGCEPSEVVFTSGATEAAAMMAGGGDPVHSTASAHECTIEWASASPCPAWNDDGEISWSVATPDTGEVSLTEIANGETGICIEPWCVVDDTGARVYSRARHKLADWPRGTVVVDATQWLGKRPLSFRGAQIGWGAEAVFTSAHKLGGPKGTGALVAAKGLAVPVLLRGGGQESGRRSGTENVVGIAGFGAAAEAARRDLEAGVWERVSQVRDKLEERLESAAPDLILVGRGGPRLPNTSCFAVPGWAGETQVMQMDLAGFAVSAGSACSSGRVKKASRVLLAMGFDEVTASSAIRVSMGPATTEAEAMAFADAWIDRYRRRNSRAA